MFGRSGQMFPRRTYHDAIYEEEYGSETEEECCRGRGLSAILCWFLSVVVLIGLAASVVLTVFFILKSRNALAKNNQEDFNPDLNFVLDHGNGFKISPTTTDYNLNYSSSKVPVGLGNVEIPTTTTYVETRTTSMTTTTTKLPPTTRLTTRKYWSDTTGDPFGDYNQRTTAMPPTTDSNSMFKILFNTIKTFNDSPQYGESVEQTPIDEVISNESVERFVPHPAPTTSSPTPSSYLPTTTRTMTSTSPVLFTLPPNTSTLGQFNKKSTTTRFPERTSFSSEDTSATTYQQYDQTKQYSPPSVSSSEDLETTSEVSTTFKPPYNEEPSQEEDSLTKMLMDQIPPHRDNHDNFSPTTTLTTSTSTTTSTTTIPTASPTTVITEDLLSKIIKNLQPKWNKTKDTTGSSGPSRTRNRYIELDRNATEYKSGNFKVKRVKVRVTTTVPPTTVIFITPDKPDSTLSVTDSHNADSSESVTNIQKSPTLSPNQGIELIQSPDLGHKETQDRDMTRDNAFLDILVGSDDHKSLITKETDAGIITSAILPPWYDTSSNSTDTMELTNHTLKFTKTDILDEDDDKNDQSKAKSDLDILLNLFSNSPLPSDGGDKSGYPKSETYIPEQSPEESNRKTHLKDLEEQFKPFFGTGPEEGNPSGTTGTSGTQKVSPANNAFHYGSTDGTTHIYGYYPEEDLDEGESVDQVDIEIDDNDKRRNGRNESNEEQLNNSGSHVIDIAFDPKAHPEIVIEPDDVDGEGDDAEYSDNDNYSDVIEPIAAGSDIQAHQVYAQPPKNLQSSGPSDLGGGIRRPMSDEDGDLYPAATEPKGHQSDWSSKQSGNSAVPPNEELPEEYLEEFSEELPDEDKPLEEDPKSMKDTAYSAEYPSNVQAHAMERKPILNVEDSVLTKSKNDNDMTTTTTTVKPRVRVYEVYSEPFKTTTQPPESAKKEEADVTLESEEFEPNSNKSGFVAPTPISFHENPFAVSNTNPDYVSRDGWRPVLYDRPSGSKNRPDSEKQQQPTVTTSNEQYFLSTSMQPPPFSSSPVLQITTPIRSPVTTPSNPKMSPPDEYEDEEGSNPASNEQWYNDQPGTGDEDNRESESKLKIKPSMQIPMPPPSNPPRVKFPVGENQPVLNRQPLLHPQHQNAQANMQNNFIDRTKYMHRPARPPILMRRKPPFNLPFSNRKRNKVQMNSNSIPNRNLPRGPYQAAGSNGPGSGPFQHPENPNVPVVRNRQDFIPNPHLTPGGHPPPGNVRWPADDNFVRRNIPPHMNRRPMG